MRPGDAVIVENLADLPLEPPGPPAAAIYDRPIGLRLLHADRDSGEEHYLISYPPGLKGSVHRHTAAHTIVVLSGRLEANGQVIGPGSYAHFPAGRPMRHQSGGDEECRFVIAFHGPFDVELVEAD